MKTSSQRLLCCPTCLGTLTLSAPLGQAEILTGRLC